MEEADNLEDVRHHLRGKASFVVGSKLRFYKHRNATATTTVNGLPILILRFKNFIQEDLWHKHPEHPSQLIYMPDSHRTVTLSFHLKILPYEYMSHHLFYSVLQQNLTHCGDKGSTLKLMVIHIHKLIQHVLNKSDGARNCKYLEMFVDMNFKLEFIWDERIPEETQRVRPEIILPASNLSIMQLPERMEIDDDQCLKDVDCVICLEQLEEVGNNILCLPCSHMFHGNCITTWLHKNRCCPTCRNGMPTIFDEILELNAELDS